MGGKTKRYVEFARVEALAPASVPSVPSALQDHLAEHVGARTREILERRSRSTLKRRGWLVRRIFPLVDVVALLSAFFVSGAIFTGRSSSGMIAPTHELLLFVIAVPLLLLVAKLYGLYDRDEERAEHSTVDDLVALFHFTGVTVLVFLAVAWLTDLAHPYPPKLVAFWGLGPALIFLFRAAARTVVRRRPSYVQNAVIVGAGEVGQLLASKLQRSAHGINVVGFVDAAPKERPALDSDLAILGSPEDLPEIVRLLDVDRVLVAFTNDGHEDLLAALREVDDDIVIDIVPRLFEIVGPRGSIYSLEGLPLVGLAPMYLPRSSLFLKRALDIVGSALLLLVAAPFLLIIASLIKLDTGGRVFYKHERLGRGGELFHCVKFRTMHERYCRGNEYGGKDADEEFERLLRDPYLRAQFEAKYKLESDPRVTRVGRFLRKTSLDEVPQLLNVIAGQMSLVGPRPITLDEMERYGSQGEALLTIKPGMTGYWQINGRSDGDYAERVRLDLSYVRGWSLGLDLLILLKTLRVMVSGRGSY